MTAAHCVGVSEDLYAYFGIDGDGVFETGCMIEPENIHFFPGYTNAHTSGHDIGLYNISKTFV